MNNVDALRISQQRDDIYDSIVARFRVHMENDDVDSALCLADEFYEWMDPDQLENEPTLFYNEHELKEHYERLCGE
jgi:putative SOS response-associated peptidase YedK